MTTPKIRALYEGDTYICTGTVREIAEFTGLSIGNVKNISTPSYKKRFTDQTSKYWIVDLEDEEE